MSAIFGEIVEAVIKHSNILGTNNVFSPSQCGFIPGRSTAGAVEAMVDKILLTFESRR